MGNQRHHDYVFQLGTLAPGAIAAPLQLPMDSDAPFVLRALGGYSIEAAGTSEETPSPLPAMLLFRYTDAGDNYLQTGRTPGLLAQPSSVDYVPLRQHVTYPARGMVTMQFENATADTLTNCIVIFRGVKLFPGDRDTSPVYAPTYPECYSQTGFQYAVSFAVGAGLTVPNQPLYINDDADFAWRCTEIFRLSSTANSQTTGLEIILKDPVGKAFSSSGRGQAAWIRAHWLFATSPARTGLWFPEIYIGRGQQFQYDARNINPANPATGQFTLDGAKVYRRQAGGTGGGR